MRLGLSIIICCHNSAARIKRTLECILSQIVQDFDIEVILVDNASTDETSSIANDVWADAPRYPFRIIQENRQGLTYARIAGIQASAYGIVAFVDDDNWINPDWAQRIMEHFENDPGLAACGGAIQAVCEVPPPVWFQHFEGNFSVRTLPYKTASYVTEALNGAGLAIRKNAYLGLMDQGFGPLLSDRKGTKLSSGGDFELCYALLLAGWKILYDPAIIIKHFMPKERLQWEYLRKLNCGIGEQSVILNTYEAYWMSTQKRAPFDQKRWSTEVIRCAYYLLRLSPYRLLDCFGLNQGNPKVLIFETQLGRLCALFKLKNNFETLPMHLAQARWVSKQLAEELRVP